MEQNRSNAKIFSKAETEIVLGRALLRDALKAGWISACAYTPRKTDPPRSRSASKDIKAVEERVRAGEYPQNNGTYRQIRTPQFMNGLSHKRC
jgi:hypothetical protein